MRIEPLMNELLAIMANLMSNDTRGPAEVGYRALVRLADACPSAAYALLLGDASATDAPVASARARVRVADAHGA